jgi:hypothetical protein
MKDLVTLFATNHIGNIDRETEYSVPKSYRTIDQTIAPSSGSYVESRKADKMTECEVIELNIQRALRKAA